MNLGFALQRITEQDVDQLCIKEKEYGHSWRKRGGVGAFMMLARKWDRIENLVTTEFGYNIFKAVVEDGTEQGVIDDIRDLRRYLLLVEEHAMGLRAEIRANDEAIPTISGGSVSVRELQNPYAALANEEEQESVTSPDWRMFAREVLKIADHEIRKTLDRQLSISDNTASLPLISSTISNMMVRFQTPGMVMNSMTELEEYTSITRWFDPEINCWINRGAEGLFVSGINSPAAPAAAASP